MQRGSGLKRNTPLKSHSELRRTTQLERTPMRKTSSKPKAQKRAHELADLPAIAKGKPCQIRLPGCHGWAIDTTVLAHCRLAGTCGIGLKPPDTNGAWGCRHCHDIVDGRRKFEVYGMEEARAQMIVALALRDGVLRTLYELHQLGYRMVKL